jgi:23S rRNA pseudouridine1911/1915/1917 synthase
LVGNVAEEKRTIEGNLARLERSYANGSFADRNWQACNYSLQVLERFGYVTLISCQLETGRTHQIRKIFKTHRTSLFLMSVMAVT